MLAYIPKIFAAYRQVKRRLHTVLEHLVAHADRNGRCWPSSRTLAELIGDISKSTVARYLNELVRDGHVTRQREKRPGGGWHFVYTVAPQFLPAARDRSGVPSARGAVSQRRGAEEKSWKKKSNSTEFGKDTELPDDRLKWEARLRSWRKSCFWLPLWGAKPGETGCMVPAALLTG